MFNKRLMELRQASGMTQEQLAKMLGVSVGRVQRWEKPNGGSPSMEQLLCIAHRFNVTIDYLLGFTDVIHPETADGPGPAGNSKSALVTRPAALDPREYPIRREKPAQEENGASDTASVPQSAPVGAIPAGLLRKLCMLRPEEMEMAEEYITRLIEEREDFYRLF